MSKKKSKIKIPRPPVELTVCKDCRIRLVVSAEDACKCQLCGSPNVTRETWRK